MDILKIFLGLPLAGPWGGPEEWESEGESHIFPHTLEEIPTFILTAVILWSPFFLMWFIPKFVIPLFRRKS